MFSQLGPLFKAQFRQAESNDTRQYIPHEERDKNRKKEEEELKQKKSDETAWTDDASVSVLALRAFLIDFLKTLPGGEDHNFTDLQNVKKNHNARPKEKTRPTNTYSAKAVRAYQTMATHAQDDPPPPDEPKTQNNAPTADKLQSKEIRDIHQLIVDLDALEKRGVATLHILKASSFVESLKQAIKKQNQKFNT